MRPNAIFIGKFITVHVITYFLTGIIAFNTFMNPLYFGEAPLFGSFMVMPENELLWGQVVKKMLPIQIVRALLLGMVFFSLLRTIRRMSYKRRFITFFGFYFIVGFLAGPAIGPGTLEGTVYMLPKFAPQGHFLAFCEAALQSLLLSAWLARWMRTEKIPEEDNQ